MDGYFVELNSAWERLPRLQRRGAARRRRSSSSSTPTTASAPKPRRPALFEGSDDGRLREPLPGQGRQLALAALELDPGRRRVADLRPRHRRHRAEAGRVRTREPADRGRGAGPQRRPHRAAEPARRSTSSCRARWRGPAAPSRDALPGDRRHRPLQGLQRRQRPPRRRRDAARMRGRLGRGAARRRHDRPLRRRGVPRRPPRLPARAGGGDRRTPARGDARRADLLGRPRLLGLRRERPTTCSAAPTAPSTGPRPRGRDRLVQAPPIES